MRVSIVRGPYWQSTERTQHTVAGLEDAPKGRRVQRWSYYAPQNGRKWMQQRNIVMEIYLARWSRNSWSLTLLVTNFFLPLCSATPIVCVKCIFVSVCVCVVVLRLGVGWGRARQSVFWKNTHQIWILWRSLNYLCWSFLFLIFVCLFAVVVVNVLLTKRPLTFALTNGACSVSAWRVCVCVCVHDNSHTFVDWGQPVYPPLGRSYFSGNAHYNTR